MSEKLFVVTGASGHIGRRLAGLLLEGHRKVRVVARREEQLRHFGEQGAEVFAGDLQDAGFVRRACEGAHAAFTMVPPAIVDHDLRGTQNRISEAIAYGLREARVPYVVNLSSWGAEVPYGTGPIAGLHDHEERLDRLDDSHVVHLRAASFMENHLHAIGAILHAGIYPSTLRGDLPLPMIATRDIAEEAARLLAGLEFEGKSTQSLLGPREYTMQEAAHILGAAIGKPELPYVQVTDEQAHQAMVAQGMPGHMADLMLEMNRAFNSGKIRPEEPRLPDNTTPTTLEEWAPHFVDTYKHHQHSPRPAASASQPAH
ncbi:MAG: NAD(P)H-binding protein [Acidobacteria bacterium]|nr:NAD(P)H-binding protein [Acidobacteriota bacterium]